MRNARSHLGRVSPIASERTARSTPNLSSRHNCVVESKHRPDDLIGCSSVSSRFTFEVVPEDFVGIVNSEDSRLTSVSVGVLSLPDEISAPSQ